MSEAKKFNSSVLLAPALGMALACAVCGNVNQSDRPDAFRIIYIVLGLIYMVLALVALGIGYCKGASFLKELFDPHAVHFFSSIPLFWAFMVKAFQRYLSWSDQRESSYKDWIDYTRYVYIILMLLCLLVVGISYLMNFGPDCFNFEAAITLIALLSYPSAETGYALFRWGDYFESHRQIMVAIVIILLLKNLGSSKDYVLNAVALASSCLYVTSGFMDGFVLTVALLVLMFPNYIKFITLDNWLPVILSPLAFGCEAAQNYRSTSFYSDSIAFMFLLVSIFVQVVLAIYLIFAIAGKTKK